MVTTVYIKYKKICLPFIVKPKIVCMHRDEVVNSVISQQAHLWNFQRYHEGRGFLSDFKQV